MSNNKQSSVEWFQEQIIKIVNGTCLLSEIEIFEQAKEMHKQEIERAYYEGIVIVMSKPDDDMLQLSQQYYNETFGGNNES